MQRRKLIYVDDFVGADPPLGSATANIFRCNSLFDPDFTGVGHQPMGFDQMATLYRSYRVHHVSFKVTFRNSNLNRMVVGLMTTEDPIPVPSVNRLQELPRNRWRILEPEDAVGAARHFTTITFSLKPFKLLGVPYKDDSYSATVFSNPSRNAYIHLWVGPIGGGVDLIGANITVRISYFAEFFDPLLLGQS